MNPTNEAGYDIIQKEQEDVQDYLWICVCLFSKTVFKTIFSGTTQHSLNKSFCLI